MPRYAAEDLPCSQFPTAWIEAKDVVAVTWAARRCINDCPALLECRDLADRLENNSTDRLHVFGVWGGEGPGQRRKRRKAAAKRASGGEA